MNKNRIEKKLVGRTLLYPVQSYKRRISQLLMTIPLKHFHTESTFHIELIASFLSSNCLFFLVCICVLEVISAYMQNMLILVA